MLNLLSFRKELKSKSDLKRAEASYWFFKTGKGEYGEGDVFWGVITSEKRRIAKKYSQDLKFADLQKLLKSKVHDERQTALFVLVNQFQHAMKVHSIKVATDIFKFYLKSTKYINNWDLVDLSAPKITGEYLNTKTLKDRKILYKLAKSKNLWEKRIAIISTFAFIRNNNFQSTLKISEMLLNDKHDLMHKAVGWALREVGKKDLAVEEKFLKKHYKKMPRTMLRYAIERFPEKKRKMYLNGSI